MLTRTEMVKKLKQKSIIQNKTFILFFIRKKFIILKTQNHLIIVCEVVIISM